MDCLDIAEKELQKKAAAKADTEQPEKEVKNKNRGKWYVINYANALLNSGISGEARILADYIISNQGKDWKFYPYEVKLQTGLSEKKYYECLNELESVKAIHPRIKIRNGRKYEAGVKLIWNFNYQTWKSKVKELSQNGNVQNGNVQNGLSQNGGSINIDKDLISPPGNSEHSSNDLTSLNSEHEEKREGAAAKPQPAPPPGTASKESSFPETAQGQQNGNKYQIPLTVPEVMEPGQIDLFGEPERVPEKPKKGSKGKGKAAGQETAGEIEIPTLEQVAEYITKYITEKKAIEFWTVYEIQLTAEKILNNPKAKKWKDWRQGVRNWIMGGHKGAFRPEVVDPARFEKGNQPGRARGQQNQKMSESDVMAILTGGNTSQETFEAESVRTIQD